MKLEEGMRFRRLVRAPKRTSRFGPKVAPSTRVLTDPAQRQKEYRYWLGWFGLEEEVAPFEQNERFWLVKGPSVSDRS